jgi:hypothetical protein
VEPLVAATLVLVAVENWRRPDAGGARWAFAFAFGLVHGLGFAAALTATGLGRNGAPLALPLLGFNLGVEAGQLAVVAVVVPVLTVVLRGPYAVQIRNVLSALIALAGGVWAVERIAAMF